MNDPFDNAPQPQPPGRGVPRRAVLASGVVSALSCTLPARARVEDETSKLVELARDKNAAFMSGDMARWADLVSIAPDFTLMQPFGGGASHGFDKSPERLAQMASYFRNGVTSLEVAKTYAGGDFVVLVMIERQTAEVGGLPAQDWSLRVTEVYRRQADAWRLAHRHADPMVRRVLLAEAAAIARGRS